MKYRAHRHPTRFPVFLEVGEDRTQTKMLNVSATGASVEADVAYPVGTAVVLGCTGTQLRATVCWSRGGMIGLAFGRPLSAAELERFRYQSSGMSHAHRPPVARSVGFRMLG